MDLSNLHGAAGSAHSDNFRRGRGHGSGNGKTAGKGHKGQKARSGAPRPGFEGCLLYTSSETVTTTLLRSVKQDVNVTWVSAQQFVVL